MNNFAALSLWTLAGDGLGRLFRSDIAATRLNRGFALVFACVDVAGLTVGAACQGARTP